MTGNDARQKLHVSTAKRTPETNSKETKKVRKREQLMMALAPLQIWFDLAELIAVLPELHSQI